ncbi:MAG: hypothetical protein V1748_05215 [Actinomycetota bacterium]
MSNGTDLRNQETSRWRRWGSYALGIVIETVAVLAISGLALLILFIVKAFVR